MNNLSSIVLIIIGTIIGSFGSLYLKKGSDKFKIFEIHKTIKHQNIIKGFLLYGISVIIYVIALSNADLSLVYPFVSLGYVWVALLSFKLLKEKITKYKIIGISIIVLGVILVGLGA